MKRTVLDKEARIYKSALRRGAGECFTMLSTESARRKFRPLVMWACTCDLAYDVQIEGSRALLLSTLSRRSSLSQSENPVDIGFSSRSASFCRTSPMTVTTVRRMPLNAATICFING